MPASTRRAFLSNSVLIGLASGLASLSPALAQSAARLRFRELYGQRMVFTDKVKQLAGQRVIMRGFMAPPLKPDAMFFIMTKMPMAICPFCDNEADWPDDIVLVRLRQPFEAVRFNKRIEVSGTLEVGLETDPETGFVSLLRIVDAEFKLAAA